MQSLFIAARSSKTGLLKMRLDTVPIGLKGLIVKFKSAQVLVINISLQIVSNSSWVEARVLRSLMPILKTPAQTRPHLPIFFKKRLGDHLNGPLLFRSLATIGIRKIRISSIMY